MGEVQLESMLERGGDGIETVMSWIAKSKTCNFKQKSI
jgi:hypothetical protein